MKLNKNALAAALEKQTESTAVAEAQRDQALAVLAALMKQQDTKEYRTAEQQSVLRWASAVLAEMGRSP